MYARDFPGHLCERLISYYMLRFPTKKIYEEGRIMDSLEPSLRKECMLTYADYADVWIRSSPHFARNVC
jgi:hypothetical protein